MTCENCCYKIEQSYGTNGECTYRDCGKPSDKPCPAEINEMENENMAEQKTQTEPQTCPYCGDTLNPTRAMNALSRWLRNTYICPSCGEFEAMIDYTREGKPLCFTSLSAGVGVVVQFTPGYYPLAANPLGARRARIMSFTDAQATARDLNARLHDPIDQVEESRIVATSMRAYNDNRRLRHQGAK